MDKVCLTTFVYGETYQAYIPFLIYSCNKAYPDYDLHIFVYGKLGETVKDQVNIIDLKCKLSIYEDSFSDFKKMTPLISKTLRWLLWDDGFLNYNYLYTVDIDMLYIREPMPLHQQHKKHMELIGLPFSNLIRIKAYSPLKPYNLLKSIKELGFFYTFKNLTFKRIEKKLSGLHFIKVNEYYKFLTDRIRQEAIINLKTGKYLKEVFFPNNEIYLYKLIESTGIDLTNLGVQKNSTNMLDPTPNRLEFRPHHGIHIGAFYSDSTVKATAEQYEIPIYKYYFKVYNDEILNDPIFIQLLQHAPPFVKESFRRLNTFVKSMVN